MRSLSTITIAYMNISAVTGFRLCISRLIAGRTFAASDAGVVVLVAAVVAAACPLFVLLPLMVSFLLSLAIVAVIGDGTSSVLVVLVTFLISMLAVVWS